MNLVTKRDLIRDMIARRPDTLGHLDKDTATVEDVSKIVGSTSWADIYCAECGELKDSAVLVEPRTEGCRYICEGASLYLCESCLRTALALFDGWDLDRNG